MAGKRKGTWTEEGEARRNGRLKGVDESPLKKDKEMKKQRKTILNPTNRKHHDNRKKKEELRGRAEEYTRKGRESKKR